MANRASNLDPLVFSIQDLEAEGTRRLEKEYRDFYDGGAMDMITCVSKCLPWRSLTVSGFETMFRPTIDIRFDRAFFGTSPIWTIFGYRASFPCGLSPSAMHCLAHPDGELATSRAAAKAEIPMVLSSYSNIALEDVKAQGTGNPYMMQMCVVRDRSRTVQLLERAESECLTIVAIAD
jgi:(S)-2-hydroxy-acid oxidase